MEWPALDKTQLSVVDLAASGDDLDYWLTKTAEERVEAIELMRQALYGYDPARTRLQRVLEVAKLE
ncbi:MAG: hypothetical protein HYV26_08890 [Candidatus Hydrogenedentes bacterium]|nr:hypothetical protein [Candidatus Hydrogenedentota bacterium]